LVREGLPVVLENVVSSELLLFEARETADRKAQPRTSTNLPR
jgi:hypothetical protein